MRFSCSIEKYMWRAGVLRLKNSRGTKPKKSLVGTFHGFYPQVDAERGKPLDELKIAAREGRFEEDGWRMGSARCRMTRVSSTVSAR
jgi:hypothetical protein